MGIKTSSKKTQLTARPHRAAFKWLLGILAVILVIAALIVVAFQVSPWPGALFIRNEFNKGGAATSKALEKYVPAGISEIENQQYRLNDKDAYLDVFYPEKTTGALPTVVWVHGGAWVSGNKDNVENYLKILTARGYTTVSINYSIAPEQQYPTPILQVNDALGYLQENAKRLHIDMDNFALAGDSAGSQIAAQVANIISNPTYANEMNVTPTVSRNGLKATVLNCGAYDLAIADYSGTWGGFLKTVLWAYSGTKDFVNDPQLRHASVVNYVTKDFPPSFITAGNVDPLEPQSTEFSKKLQAVGVDVTTLFYAQDHQPQLNHEYQFNLDTDDGKNSFEQIDKFLKKHL